MQRREEEERWDKIAAIDTNIIIIIIMIEKARLGYTSFLLVFFSVTYSLECIQANPKSVIKMYCF